MGTGSQHSHEERPGAWGWEHRRVVRLGATLRHKVLRDFTATTCGGPHLEVVHAPLTGVLIAVV